MKNKQIIIAIIGIISIISMNQHPNTKITTTKKKMYSQSIYDHSEENYNRIKTEINNDSNKNTEPISDEDIEDIKLDLGLGFSFGNELEWTYENNKTRRYKIRFSIGYNNTEYYYYETYLNQLGNIYDNKNRPSPDLEYATLKLQKVSEITLNNSSPINSFKITISNGNYYTASDITVDISYLQLLDKNGNNILNGNSLEKEYKSYISTDSSFRSTILSTTLNTTNGAFYGENTKIKAAIQLDGFKSDYTSKVSVLYEHTYNGEVATEEELEFLKEQGFKSIRLPITWFNHMDSTGTIDSEWFEEVNKIVDRILEYGFYVVIDIHHDTGEKGWIKADKTSFKEYEYVYRYLIIQIANNFKNYDHHVILEGPNEVLNYKNIRVNTNSNPISQEDYNTYNKLLQIFVEEVRSTGYKNKDRFIVLNTLGAYRENIQQFTLPKDSVDNRIFVGIHDYTMRENKVLAFFEDFQKNAGQELLEKYNIILGEFSVSRDLDVETKIEIMNLNVCGGYSLGIPMFFWDDGGVYSLMKKKSSEWDSNYQSNQVAEALLSNANTCTETYLRNKIEKEKAKNNFSEETSITDIVTNPKTGNVFFILITILMIIPIIIIIKTKRNHKTNR